MRTLIVDDDEAERFVMLRTLGRLGIDAVAVEHRVASFEALAEAFASSGADVAIVDHKLKEANFATFLGADAVVELRSRSMPAMLVTRHGTADVVSIRRRAKDIPSYLRRSEFADRPELLVAAANRAVDVVKHGAMPPDMALRKAVLHVVDAGNDREGTWVDAEIRAWSRDESVRLYLDEIAPDLLVSDRPIGPGTNLIGYVNTSAAHPEMLIVERLEFANMQPDQDGNLTPVEP